MTTYTIQVRHGFSANDHLAPIGIDGTFSSLKDAREALEAGRKAQGECETRSRQVRCDILRNDGKRFDNE
jgi:hypothetical protein